MYLIKNELSEKKLLLDQVKSLLEKTGELNECFNDNFEKLNTCETNMVKRIEWASSSNPNLTDIVKSFELLRKKRNALLLVYL